MKHIGRMSVARVLVGYAELSRVYCVGMRLLALFCGVLFDKSFMQAHTSICFYCRFVSINLKLTMCVYVGCFECEN